MPESLYPDSEMQNPTSQDSSTQEPTEAAREPQPVSVEIYGQVYRLRGTDPEYLHQLGALVDAKMRAVSAHGTTVDSLRVAVLASLNIADECARLRQRCDAMTSEMQQNVQEAEQGMRQRADSLAGLLDEVLDERKAG